MITILSSKKRGNNQLVNVQIICPKCNKAGKLISYKKSKVFGRRKYAILHEDGSRCNISWLDGEIWDRINEFYLRLRRGRR